MVIRRTYIFARLLLVIGLMNIANSGNAQVDKRPGLLTKNGIGIVLPDSQFSLNFKFRIQPRIGFNANDNEFGSFERAEFRIRRMRLKFDGFIYSTKLTYKAELGFSRSDLTFDNSGIPMPLLDAMVFYSPMKNFTIGMGQGKLPGNRSRVVSSGNIHFSDRSIVNGAYTLDRDAGVFASYKTKLGKTVIVVLKGAITSGEGRGVANSKEFSNATSPNDGLSYTGRLEILPLGAFTEKGDYFEGDLVREKKPKISIAGGYNYNDRAIRAGGQLSKTLYEARSFSGIHGDVMVKYMGWALTSEYIDRRMAPGQQVFTYKSYSDSIFVKVGYGVSTELSYTFKNMWEIASRYAFIHPDKALWTVKKDGEKYEEFALAFIKYFNGHAVKIVNEFSYFMRSSMTTGAKSSGTAGFRCQLEIGF